ncbi:MAG: helix-turn-helix domain-containing protein [Candidatus Omnitrophica bacterium]|nr:helix-turn-helix domain-containing protein [Candidatus Omnitrophota bacterium]
MKSRKLTRVQDHLQEKLRSPQFRESYAVEVFKAQIAREIIEVRIKEGLTQGELAQKIGVTQQEISKIENGEFQQIKTVMRVLLALRHRTTVCLPAEEVPLGSQRA